MEQAYLTRKSCRLISPAAHKSADLVLVVEVKAAKLKRIYHLE